MTCQTDNVDVSRRVFIMEGGGGGGRREEERGGGQKEALYIQGSRACV